MTAAGTIPDEIARFDALAAQWWDRRGPMRPLHEMNPARVAWIDARIRARFAGPVRLLDVGCGAGLAAEALARCGHAVTGVAAADRLVAIARAHAAEAGVAIDYRAGLAADLRSEAPFPVITALEVIEHVPDPQAFLADLRALLAPGGLVFLSTLNRTRRAWLTAIAGAEHLLRLLPVGTHDWRKFIPPAELAALLRAEGLRLADIAGLTPDPARGGWRAGRDTSVNYIVMAHA